MKMHCYILHMKSWLCVHNIHQDNLLCILHYIDSPLSNLNIVHLMYIGYKGTNIKHMYKILNNFHNIDHKGKNLHIPHYTGTHSRRLYKNQHHHRLNTQISIVNITLLLCFRNSHRDRMISTHLHKDSCSCRTNMNFHLCM